MVLWWPEVDNALGKCADPLVPPGPNSDSILVSLGTVQQSFEDGNGQGCGPEPSGREKKTPISSGQAVPESLGVGHEGSHGIGKIKKRRLKRAYRRLDLHGFALYRGQVMMAPPTVPSPPCQSPAAGLMHPSRCIRKRMTVLSWNSMALSSAQFTELLQWMTLQRLDIGLVQSTHWSVAEPWMSHGYSIVPSPELNRAGGGLLLFIRTGFCKLEALSYQDIMPGRLNHV